MEVGSLGHVWEAGRRGWEREQGEDGSRSPECRAEKGKVFSSRGE